MNQLGIILLAHGSRDPLWRGPIEKVAQLIALRDPTLRVSCAYLELTQPDLSCACAEMAATGVNAIKVVPLFLGLGKHARQDLPAQMERLQQSHPGVCFTLQNPVGEDPRLLDLLATIALSL